jgi:hypothetical protein
MKESKQPTTQEEKDAEYKKYIERLEKETNVRFMEADATSLMTETQGEMSFIRRQFVDNARKLGIDPSNFDFNDIKKIDPAYENGVKVREPSFEVLLKGHDIVLTNPGVGTFDGKPIDGVLGTRLYGKIAGFVFQGNYMKEHQTKEMQAQISEEIKKKIETEQPTIEQILSRDFGVS